MSVMSGAIIITCLIAFVVIVNVFLARKDKKERLRVRLDVCGTTDEREIAGFVRSGLEEVEVIRARIAARKLDDLWPAAADLYRLARTLAVTSGNMQCLSDPRCRTAGRRLQPLITMVINRPSRYLAGQDSRIGRLADAARAIEQSGLLGRQAGLNAEKTAPSTVETNLDRS